MSFLPINSGSKLYAAIRVTYPAGQTCTCSDGSRILKAKDTDGDWLFAVPRAGTWTVTSGDKSKTVEISREGQSVNVNLDESHIVLDGEGFAESVTMTALNGGSFKTVSGAVEIYGNGNGNAYFYTGDVDVSKFSLMKVRMKGNTYASFGLGGKTAAPMTYSVQPKANNVEETLSLDLSEVSGTYNPGIYINLYTPEICATVYEWWFE
jgi:hypothetical protein